MVSSNTSTSSGSGVPPVDEVPGVEPATAADSDGADEQIPGTTAPSSNTVDDDAPSDEGGGTSSLSPQAVEQDPQAALAEAQSKIEALTEEVESFQEEALRARAEADNVRKRAQAEVASAHRYAVESFARELLGVRDSLDLAREVDLGTGDSEVASKVVEGLGITLKQLDGLLEKFSIASVDPDIGEKLDPERHQAVSIAQTNEVAPNCITQVIQKGYILHDRLLRPAMVIVAQALVEP